jgi:type IV pilus assembly protein PilQ
MVVNLLEKVPYSVVTKGNQVILTVNGSTLTSSESNGLSNQASISDIDFRRGEEGEARLIVKFTDQSPSLDVKEERGNIVVDILATALPEKLNRRLDVVDFATPVTFIDTESKGANTRLTLTTTGEYEHLAYQSENALVIEVKPLSEQQLDEQKKDQFGYKGEKLSLNFQNIEVRAVLQLLADFTGMNLVTSDTVKGNLTLRLKNVPWDQALDIILKTKGLAKRQNGNVMLVAPAAEIAAREKQELEAKK